MHDHQALQVVVPADDEFVGEQFRGLHGIEV
jgi:hypothetical protein